MAMVPSNFSIHTSESSGRYVKTQTEDGKPRSRVTESVGLRCDPGIFISSKCSNVADAAGPEKTL